MILLDGSSLTLDDLAAIAVERAPVGLTDAAKARVRASRDVVDRHAALPRAVYGINTGFGALAEVAIPPDQLAALQLNLIRSHAAGVGEPLSAAETRAVMTLRANVLAKGCSGIRLETLEALLSLLNGGITPLVPSRGSVGASGDLAPLAHLALVLVGEGELLPGSAPRPAPLTLGPKEGLALINGTQASAGVLALAVLAAGRLTRAADIAAALSIDALRGSSRPFDARIHAARPVPGQIASAGNLRHLLGGSAIADSHANCGKVQDAYALRCAPQVHGSAREAVAFAHRLTAIEANAATDNPMVFADEGDIVSGGNFHGAPVALAADTLTIGVTQLATISERRTDRLMTPHESGLPAFLIEDSGLNSGYMMAHVTAAALASELKVLAHPAAADTIPTSAGREDHVSMSMTAALKAARAVELCTQILAIELLCAAQAIDLLAPLTTSRPLAAVHAVLRARVPRLDVDRPPAPDIATVAALVGSGALEAGCPERLA